MKIESYQYLLYCTGEYNEHDIFISVPAIIDRQGVKEIVELNLTEEEQRNFDNSCKIVRDKYKELLIFSIWLF